MKFAPKLVARCVIEVAMPSNHFSPKLHKQLVLRHADYTVYAVNGLAVRNVAQPDEEFGNFATQDDFSDLIPKGEIWISQKLAPKEGVFFIADALTQLMLQADGVKPDKAYDEGLNVERLLREKLNGVEFRDGKPHKQVPKEIYLEPYLTIPDPKGPVDAWIVDGNLVRSYYKTDYTEGGHGYVYPWVPKGEIWIEDGVDRRERPYILTHEYLERRLMRDAGLGYDHAHEICSTVEFDLRKNEEIKTFLASGRRKVQKKDLPRLTRQDLFVFFLRKYVKRKS
ncbi:MAG: hypothetical protein ACJ8FY_24965 [Gemmataceae bacterium]